MAKIGMMMSHPDLDAPLAEHFGKAKWILVASSPSECEVVRNETLTGSGVASELSRRGCTDVIVRHLGPGARGRLVDAGLRVWRADPGAAGRAQLRLLEAGALSPFEPDDDPGHDRRHHGAGPGRAGSLH